MKFILKIVICFGVILLGKLTKEKKEATVSTTTKISVFESSFTAYKPVEITFEEADNKDYKNKSVVY